MNTQSKWNSPTTADLCRDLARNVEPHKANCLCSDCIESKLQQMIDEHDLPTRTQFIAMRILMLGMDALMLGCTILVAVMVFHGSVPWLALPITAASFGWASWYNHNNH